MKPKIIRYPNKIKIDVVYDILHGELLLEEAMEKYGILTKKTIVRWLKKYQREHISIIKLLKEEAIKAKDILP